ncbi:MAG: tRNA dimethylallyltransferase [Salibacteraceae bacterium]|jgi:tRNA dimethylallyltransferase
MKYLIVVAGPTASGKTELGIKLAQKFNTSILSVDSRQFYREINIGTAKPTEEELAEAEHLFVNNLSIHDEYSVGDYERDALKALDEIYKEKDVALMVGGSGLFIQAVCEGLNEFPVVSKEIREELTKTYEKHGIWMLQKELKEVDPEYYEFVDTNNHQRLIRALEIYRASGQPYSSFRDQPRKERSFIPIYIVLDWDREELYERVNLRVDIMMKDGLLKEIESLMEHRDLNALQTVGYQEFFSHKDGDYDIYEAIRLVKRNSRRYAKRQMTWFRKIEEAGFFHPEDIDSISRFIDVEMGIEVLPLEEETEEIPIGNQVEPTVEEEMEEMEFTPNDVDSDED